MIAVLLLFLLFVSNVEANLRIRRTPPAVITKTTTTTVYLAPRVRHWFQRPLPHRRPKPLHKGRIQPCPTFAYSEYLNYYQNPHQACVTCAVVQPGAPGK
ncbi:unnamed protein product [Cylicocyclus nassatus]|uniref:Secreted protein n=1 Tax=Cylicocyclus nassatus TaxID=53992 RepID=A0AA36H8Q2_CYLNA|nr:unnamed protein product [Cylicocyclus nassatus]